MRVLRRSYCIRFDGQVGTANKGGAPSPSGAAALDLGPISLSCVQSTRNLLLRWHRLGKLTGKKKTSHPHAKASGPSEHPLDEKARAAFSPHFSIH